jgi:hypothetical protein
MKQTNYLLLALSLVGCVAPVVTINLPPDHPAAPSAREAAYAPTPTPIEESSAVSKRSSEEVDGKKGTPTGGTSHMHHHHGGGSR